MDLPLPRKVLCIIVLLRTAARCQTGQVAISRCQPCNFAVAAAAKWSQKNTFTSCARIRYLLARVCPLYRAIVVPAFLLLAISSAQAESGLASYYGGRGHTGGMTCAHRTRPLGSTISVTHAGHTIRCIVNDRGPFIRGRIVDVSVSAARALGMMEAGVVRVSVQ